tara:strand:+ start:68 stop:334 length:267 start_codon:yes stop_codon:yes gene_type:complete
MSDINKNDKYSTADKNSYMDEQDFLEQRLDEQANERALADRKSFLTEAVDAIADAKFLAENDHRTTPLTVDQLLKIAEVYALLAKLRT